MYRVYVGVCMLCHLCVDHFGYLNTRFIERSGVVRTFARRYVEDETLLSTCIPDYILTL